jgi:hypothetical protein
MYIVGALGDFLAACWARVAIWLLAMIVAIIPAIHVANVHLSPSIDSMAKSVSKVGFFHDFYFVVIIAAIFGISNILYSSFFSERRISLWVAASFVTSIMFFLYTIINGVFEFSALAQVKANIDPLDFAYDVGFIQFTLSAGIFTEIVIALRERLP